MSFFFDVWTSEGFVLASDVRYLVNDVPCYVHKLKFNPRSRVPCAIAVYGEYPENCLNFFWEATSRKDTLREIAHHFAARWTQRYAGTEDYSAVHLVGFERMPNSDEFVPQVWYWHNWAEGEGFLSEERLQAELGSFSNPVPCNDHLPRKIEEWTGKPFVVSAVYNLHDERLLTESFLRLYEPVFTWNGDTRFWRSATDAVGSAMKLISRQKATWTIAETAELTNVCLEFLARVGSLIPESTVGLSPKGECDVLMVTRSGVKPLTWAELPEE